MGSVIRTKAAWAMITVMVAAGCAAGAPRASSPAAATQTPAAATATAGVPQTPAAATAGAPANLNGTYRWEITLEEAEAADMVDPEDTYPQVDTIKLNNGELEGGCFGVAGGTYEVKGDRITFHSIEYDYGSTVTFSRDADGSLHLTPVPPMDPGDAFQCFSQVWTKIE